jgi:hypothetical protein
VVEPGPSVVELVEATLPAWLMAVICRHQVT